MVQFLLRNPPHGHQLVASRCRVAWKVSTVHNLDYTIPMCSKPPLDWEGENKEHITRVHPLGEPACETFESQLLFRLTTCNSASSHLSFPVLWTEKHFLPPTLPLNVSTAISFLDFIPRTTTFSKSHYEKQKNVHQKLRCPKFVIGTCTCHHADYFQSV